MMFKQVSVECRPWTQEYAKTFSGLPIWKGDRDHNSKMGRMRLLWLHEKVRTGMFFSPVWSVVSVNGTSYRIDGGHSSAMLSALSPPEFPAGLDVVIRHFVCPSEDAMPDLFAQFDAKKSMRSYRDKVHAHKVIESTLDQVGIRELTCILSGLAFALSDFQSTRAIEEDERASLVHEYSEFVLWVGGLNMKRFMQRTSILAVVFVTWQRDADAATEFWSLVADESHPDRNNATRTLARFLSENFGRGDQRTRKPTGPRWDVKAYAVKAIHAWNAWRRGETTSLSYFPNAPIPKPI